MPSAAPFANAFMSSGTRTTSTPWESKDHLIHEMDPDRRQYDKTAPLICWATRHVETDPRLRDLSVDAQLTHFRVVPGHLRVSSPSSS